MAVPIDMPNNPTVGELYTATNGVQYLWDGTKWTSVGGGGGGGNTTVTVADDPPPSPAEGNLWFNSSNGILYIWYVDADQSAPLGEGQWVDTRPGGEGGGGGGGSQSLESVCANGFTTTTNLQSGGATASGGNNGTSLLPTGQLQVSAGSTSTDAIQIYTTGDATPNFQVTGGGTVTGTAFAAQSTITSPSYSNDNATFAVSAAGLMTSAGVTSNGAVSVTGTITSSSTNTASKFIGNFDIDSLPTLP